MQPAARPRIGAAADAGALGSVTIMTEPQADLIQRVQGQFRHIDPVAQVVLKGHLLMEELLTGIIERFLFHPDLLDQVNLRFFQKAHLARSLSLDEHDNDMWDLVLAINELRNQLAHSLDDDKRQPKIAKVRKLYFKEAADTPGIEHQRTLDDEVILAFAASLVVGFLSTFRAEADRFRDVVRNLDREMNPHRHTTDHEGGDSGDAT